MIEIITSQVVSFVDFTESGTFGANLEFPKGILWRSSVTSMNDLGFSMPLCGSEKPSKPH